MRLADNFVVGIVALYRNKLSMSYFKHVLPLLLLYFFQLLMPKNHGSLVTFSQIACEKSLPRAFVIKSGESS